MKIRLIHTNDIHSTFDKLIKMASVIKQLKENHNCLLLDAGDFNDFSNLVTFGSHGEAGLKILANLGFKALTIGNNEGFQPIETIENNASLGLVTYLSCNIFKSNMEPLKNVLPSMIITISNIRFLIIGVSPYQQSYNDYYHKYDLLALKPHELIKKELVKYQNQYDVAVLLSHLGLKSDVLLTQTLKGLDIIVAGHSHQANNCVLVNGTYIHQSGVRGSHVGYLDLEFENNKLISVKGDNIVIDDNIKDDEETLKLYQKYQTLALDNLATPLFEIPCDLYYQVDQESNLTNVLADYLKNHYDGDFAMINSGLTEANLKKGTISMLDILNVCNSPLYIATMEIKGSLLLEAIKWSKDPIKCADSFRRPGFRGKFLGKLHFSYNCLVNDNDFYVNEHKIEPQKYYKIITTDYFVRGMGYELLIDNYNACVYNQSLVDALKEALKDKNSYKYNKKLRWG